MSHITLTRIHKYFGDTEVLHGIDLNLPQGSVLALLGPSGCGKTTLLRLIAGFETLDQGQIAFDDRIVASPTVFIPPERRGIGYVPQEGTLFPHLTVEGNVRFGLSRQTDRRRRVQEVLALTDLEGLGNRYPHELSGGQQQRVALARALAPDPAVLLLDEPFNALDLDLRRSMCEEVTEVLHRTGTTAIMVTHDPSEAFAVSDQLAVMQSGLIMQCSNPETVYWQPVNPTVARLTGAAIFLPGHIHAGNTTCTLGSLTLYDEVASLMGEVNIMIRPEQIKWQTDGPGASAQVVHRSFRGDHTLVRLALSGLHLDLRIPSLSAPALGAHIHIQVRGDCMAYRHEAGTVSAPI